MMRPRMTGHWPFIGGTILCCLLGFAISAQSETGWYLMAPPIRIDSTGTGWVDYENPLRTWLQIGAFDSARACNEEKAEQFQRAEAQYRSSPASGSVFVVSWAKYAQAFRSLCIGSNDPRLR
jgi:hypothetical protein